jgi:hypothetical protein
MGGTAFTTRAKGKSAREAFDAAVSHAQFMHGHGGYSGTIAEKSSFVVIGLPMGQDPKAFVEHLLEDDDPRVADKWGPRSGRSSTPTSAIGAPSRPTGRASARRPSRRRSSA